MDIAKKFLFLLLLPVYAAAILLLNYTQKWWEGLLD